ncbi:MAG TPA: M23 family metallopeptidase [Ramlibacter sp.]|uniref:M23 family metallopeptidase n=1 Tax=Ramlibacter sp. TaxID=1917967 RepID=UPI002ED54FEE
MDGIRVHPGAALAGLLAATLLLVLPSANRDRPAPAPVVPPVAAPQEPVAAAPTPGELLAARRLVVPVQGVARTRVRDTYEACRSLGRKHRAIDIMAPWGTPVLAADDGRVEKIARNRSGGLTVYQVDGSGRFVYYYAHFAGYTDDLREGQRVRRGDVIGYVGTTGNAAENAPHLHFQVLLLAEGRRWWGGEPVNPFAALTQD